ncbi:hypothetical protein NPIL_91791 [Nephila pilipes]|uniref:Uncharacterized protein n=1 Tax=Nephila pilipes TaxID=299642 RepID=A0A8X6NXG3_NEPPI|nr:hypothetical protein NPIL_91791 [Nephila pilipes]
MHINAFRDHKSKPYLQTNCIEKSQPTKRNRFPLNAVTPCAATLFFMLSQSTQIAQLASFSMAMSKAYVENCVHLIEESGFQTIFTEGLFSSTVAGQCFRTGRYSF